MTLPTLSSWRTTLTGASALIFAVADLIVMFHNKDWDGNKLGVDVLAILTGLGLISARDNAVSVQEHAVQAVALAETAAVATVAIEKADTAVEVVKEVEHRTTEIEQKDS